MSFTGDHPIVETVLYDVSGSAISLRHSASVDLSTQPGVAIAGFYSTSLGVTARVLQVDDEGRLMVDAQLVPSGVQQVTGSVAISGPVTINQPVAVTDNGGSLTVDGTVDVTDGGGSLTVDDGGSSITVDGTVTAQVTGTVNLDRGNDAALPLFITGSISAVASGIQEVTGTVAISGPVTINQPVAVTDNNGSLTVDGSVSVFTQGAQLISGSVSVFTQGAQNVSGSVSVYTQGAQLITGSVTASVTGTVNLDRGNDTTTPLFVSGTVGIGGPVSVTGSVALSGISVITGTVALENGYSELDPFWISGSVAVNNLVRVESAIHTAASGTFFANTTSAVTIAASSATRRGLTIYNESNRAMYIKFGAGASATDYTYKIFSDDGWTMPDFLYSGVITAVWASAGTSGAQVTIITP